MTKKFELSAYGVEEMNQKELIDVEGGLGEYLWLYYSVQYAVDMLQSPEGQAYIAGYNHGYYDGFNSGWYSHP
jgi:hypothetical protein